jgi:trimeric autotransporter adhesin
LTVIVLERLFSLKIFFKKPIAFRNPIETLGFENSCFFGWDMSNPYFKLKILFLVSAAALLSCEAKISVSTRAGQKAATVAVTATKVSATEANGTYISGQSLEITVTFSNTVNVTGTPTLTLATGSTPATATYKSGSGSNILKFNYTIGENDTSKDLDYTDEAALGLSGATLQDSAGGNVVSSLPKPGQSGSLGDSKNIVIVTKASLARSFNLDFGTSADYVRDETNVGVQGGYAKLNYVDDTHDAAEDFSKGTANGVVYDSSYLQLGTAGGCNALTTNCNELDSSWAPNWGSMVGYWKFNETSYVANQSNAVNDSRSSNHGIPRSTVTATQTAGQIKVGRGAASLNGTSDYFEINTSLDDNFGSGFSFSGWIRATSVTSNRPIFSNFNASNGSDGIVLKLASGKPTINLYDSGSGNYIGRTASITTLPVNTWYHIAATWDGTLASSGFRIYINGYRVDDTDSGSGTVNSFDQSLDPIVFGRDIPPGPGTFFSGQFDDFSFWTTVITQNQAAQIFDRQQAVYAGSYVSQAVDLGRSGSWTHLSWSPYLPYFKPLTAGVGNESLTEYPGLVNSSGVSGNSNLMTNLIAFYHLDSVNTTTWTDSVNGYNGTSGNNVALATDGLMSNAAVFDGNNDYIALTTNATMNTVQDNNYSLSAWVWIPRFPPGANETTDTGSFGVVMKSGLHSGLRVNTNGTAQFDHWLTGSVNEGSSGNTPVRPYYWAHLVGVLERTSGTAKIYLDGKLEGNNNTFTAGTATHNYGTTPWYIGIAQPGSGTYHWYHEGKIDEVGIWSRALSANEVRELYLRGANRIRAHVRSCSDSSCGGSDWNGSAGTTTSYLDEQQNCATVSSSTGACTGALKTTKPSYRFADFPMTVSDQRYFQYQMFLDSNDRNSLCSSATCSTYASSVGFQPQSRYYGGPTWIANKTGISGTSFRSLSAKTSGTCSVSYQVSGDGSKYYYWNGLQWNVAGDLSQGSSLVTINSNLSKLNLTKLYLKVLFSGDATQSCQIDELTGDYTSSSY